VHASLLHTGSLAHTCDAERRVVSVRGCNAMLSLERDTPILGRSGDDVVALKASTAPGVEIGTYIVDVGYEAQVVKLVACQSAVAECSLQVAPGRLRVGGVWVSKDLCGCRTQPASSTHRPQLRSRVAARRRAGA